MSQRRSPFLWTRLSSYGRRWLKQVELCKTQLKNWKNTEKMSRAIWQCWYTAHAFLVSLPSASIDPAIHISSISWDRTKTWRHHRLQCPENAAASCQCSWLFEMLDWKTTCHRQRGHRKLYCAPEGSGRTGRLAQGRADFEKSKKIFSVLSRRRREWLTARTVR